MHRGHSPVFLRHTNLERSLMSNIPTRSFSTRLWGASAAVALGSLLLSGCTAPSTGEGGTASGGLTIVATTTQVADFTRIVAGETASVTQLIQPNQSAHSFDPSALELQALASADVLVINGAGLEEWLDSAIEASGFNGVTIDASEGVSLDADDHAGDHPDEHVDEHPDEHADEHPDEHVDEHAHTAGNPHIWTDPQRAAQMVDNIAAGLEKADPASAALTSATASDYLDQLALLDEWIRSNVEVVAPADRLLVTNHDAFGYFLDAYGITYVGSVIPSFDDNAEPSAAQIDELVAKIRATGVKAVFSETSLSPKTAETIAREAEVTVYAGENALYGDSLGPVGSDGASYIGSQLHNVRLILESWGVVPTPLPAGLES